jgi:FKBP-type peptidyl-prolyl cis-trans isomerase
MVLTFAGACKRTCGIFLFPGSVIKGWDIGVATMRKGEKAVLTIKAE